MSRAEAALDIDGPAAPPRANGQLAFDEPWERRVFGVTMALTQSSFAYDDFRTHLIAQLADDPTRPYWRSWERALEDMVTTMCHIELDDLVSRHDQFMTRPHGHDHRH